MPCYIAPALLKSCSLAFAICKCPCVFSFEVTFLPLASDLCSVSLKSDGQIYLHNFFISVPKQKCGISLRMCLYAALPFSSPSLRSSGPPTSKCCLACSLPVLQRWRGRSGPPSASRVRCSLDIQGLRLLREPTPRSVARIKHLCITSSDPQYSAQTLSWELSTIPSFSSLITKAFTIIMPSYDTFNTQLYTVAVRLTPTPGAQTACCTVAQAHRLPLQLQCHLPREAVNLTIRLRHLCPGSPLCLSLPGSLPG